MKVKSQGGVRNKAIYLAFGVGMNGLKEVLGIWASDNKDSKFWMQVITQLKYRGVQDIFIACVDGLKGIPEAIEAIYPNTQIQLCIVHLVRHSLFYVSHQDRKEVATDLKMIYQAPTLDEADYQLSRVCREMDGGLSDGRPQLAAKLDAGDSNVLVRPGNQAGDLYNQHD